MTEIADPRYRLLDCWDDLTALRAMWEAQLAAVSTIGPVLPVLSALIIDAVPRLRRGGRLVYAGAGTSIRVAVQDGTELGPTFDWPEDRILYLIAGGMAALMISVEGAEDDAGDAHNQVTAANIGRDDVVLGIAASGRTPFTVAVVKAARDAGALTAGLACNPETPLLGAAEHAILTETGAEVVAGSTRMKGGTVQKVVLNLISTQIMVRLGHVHDGLMVDMRPQNHKLRIRARDMVSRLAEVSAQQAESALMQTGWKVKPAILVAKGYSAPQAQAALDAVGGVLRKVLAGNLS